jgi:hypothetical protein
MAKRVRTGLTRSDILDRYIERVKQMLVKFQPFLSRTRGTASLEDFDEAAEDRSDRSSACLGKLKLIL